MTDAGRERLANQRRVLPGIAARGHSPEHRAIVKHQTPNGRAAEAVRLLQDRVEHRRQIAGRGVDHLQHLGGRGLLLQRLALLGDQSRILHRNHRLGGEVLQQCDLLLRERTHFLAIDRDVAEEVIALDKRHKDRTARAAQIDDRPSVGITGPIALSVLHIQDVDRMLRYELPPRLYRWVPMMAGSMPGVRRRLSARRAEPLNAGDRRRMCKANRTPPRTTASPFPGSHRTPVSGRRVRR